MLIRENSAKIFNTTTRSEQGFSLNPMTRDEKTNITEKKALYRLEMRKEGPVIISMSFSRLPAMGTSFPVFSVRPQSNDKRPFVRKG